MRLHLAKPSGGESVPYPTGNALCRGLDLRHGQRAALLTAKRIRALTSSSHRIGPSLIPVGPPIRSNGAVGLFTHVIEHRDVTPQPANLFATAAAIGRQIGVWAELGEVVEAVGLDLVPDGEPIAMGGVFGDQP